jgi:hypothetical protein
LLKRIIICFLASCPHFEITFFWYYFYYWFGVI